MAIEKIDYEKCTNCHACYNICPMDVFHLINNEVFISFPEDCVRCFLCYKVCPTNAIDVNAKRLKPLPVAF